MLAALHMEWTKLRTMRSTAWCLLAVIGLSIGLSAYATGTTDAVHCAPHCSFDVPRLSLSGVYLGQVAVVALAALAVTSEYDTMMIRITLAACPRRLTVLAAKLTVVTAFVLGSATMAVLGSLLASRVILPGNGFTAARGYPLLSLSDPVTARACIGTVLYLALVALLSAGTCAIIRHTGWSVTAILGLLFVPPILLQFVNNPSWHDRILRYSPMTAGQAIQVTKGLRQLAVGPWQGLAILAAYAAAAIVTGALVIRCRDA